MAFTVAKHTRDEVLVEFLHDLLLFVLTIFESQCLSDVTSLSKLGDPISNLISLYWHQLVCWKGFVFLWMQFFQVIVTEVYLVLNAIKDCRISWSPSVVFLVSELLSDAWLQVLRGTGLDYTTADFDFFNSVKTVISILANVAENIFRLSRQTDLDSHLVEQSDLFIRKDGVGVADFLLVSLLL